MPKLIQHWWYTVKLDFDPQPVSGAQNLCGTWLLSNHFKVVNFRGRCVGKWKLLHKVNVVCHNSFNKIFMHVTYKLRLADFQKPFLKTATCKWRHHGCVSTISKTWFPLPVSGTRRLCGTWLLYDVLWKVGISCRYILSTLLTDNQYCETDNTYKCEIK